MKTIIDKECNNGYFLREIDYFLRFSPARHYQKRNCQQSWESKTPGQTTQTADRDSKGCYPPSQGTISRQTLTGKNLLSSRARCSLHSQKQDRSSKRIRNEIQFIRRQTWLHRFSRIHFRKYSRCKITRPGRETLGRSDWPNPEPSKWRQRIPPEQTQTFEQTTSTRRKDLHSNHWEKETPRLQSSLVQKWPAAQGPHRRHNRPSQSERKMPLQRKKWKQNPPGYQRYRFEPGKTIKSLPLAPAQKMRGPNVEKHKTG